MILKQIYKPRLLRSLKHSGSQTTVSKTEGEMGIREPLTTFSSHQKASNAPARPLNTHTQERG
jgi:hypothetical protein